MLFIVPSLETSLVVFMEAEELGAEFCTCDDTSLRGLFDHLLVYFACLFCSVVLILLSLYPNRAAAWNIEGALRMTIIDERDTTDDFRSPNTARKHFTIDTPIWGSPISDPTFFPFLPWLSHRVVG